MMPSRPANPRSQQRGCRRWRRPAVPLVLPAAAEGLSEAGSSRAPRATSHGPHPAPGMSARDRQSSTAMRPGPGPHRVREQLCCRYAAPCCRPATPSAWLCPHPCFACQLLCCREDSIYSCKPCLLRLCCKMVCRPPQLGAARKGVPCAPGPAPPSKHSPQPSL